MLRSFAVGFWQAKHAQCAAQKGRYQRHSCHILQVLNLEVLAAASPRISLWSSWNKPPVLDIKTPFYWNRLLATHRGIPPPQQGCHQQPAMIEVCWHVVEQQSSSAIEILAVSWAVQPGQDVESKTRLWLLPSRRFGSCTGIHMNWNRRVDQWHCWQPPCYHFRHSSSVMRIPGVLPLVS